MPLSDKMLKELMATFQAELEEHLGTLNKGLLSLEQGPTSDERSNLLTSIFRAAHSIKGGARAINLKDIEAIAHHIEDVLVKAREGRINLTPQHFDSLLAGVDAISAAMAGHLRGEQITDESMKAILSRLSDTAIEDREPDLPRPHVDPPEGEHAESLPRATERISEGESAPTSHPAAQGTVPSDSKVLPEAPLNPTSPPQMKDQPVPRPTPAEDTIRVRTTKLDALMDSLGELLVMQMRTEKLLNQMKALQERSLHWQKDWRKVRSHCSRLRRHYEKKDKTDLAPLFDFLEQNEQELKASSSELNMVLDSLANDRSQLQIVTDDLQNGIHSARMLPISTLFDLFPRMVRDLAHDLSKEIALEVGGQETEVDRQALELIKDPLTHLLRNALDHGIEAPEARLASGKPRQGTIRLRAQQHGSNLVLSISDDGRGIDLDGVRRAAIERGIVSKEKVADLSEREVIDLIFYSGLSTAPYATDLSGRGIGMDVVRKNLEQMRGLIHAETTAGQGTTFTLTLPLTLTTSHVLLVRVAGETIGLPMMNVERVLHLEVEKVRSIEGRPAIYAEGRPLPLVGLAHVLKLPEVEQPLLTGAKIPVVILSVVNERIALRVSGFLSTQQVVIKSLGGQLVSVRNVAGAAILGDGQLVTILNVSDLMRSIRGKSVGSMALPIITKGARRLRVLLADDSITTRALEKHILENAGYDVIPAVDGQEAWELIYNNENGTPDLVISDVNMPRMDGFALTQSIKGDNKYAHMPVVLVTSLDSPQDKLHGMEAGADAYIVKSTFDQRELLNTIERLIR